MAVKRFSQQELKEFINIIIAKMTVANEDREYHTTPYKHLVIDNFLPKVMAQNCLNDFPNPKKSNWDEANDTDIEIKLRSNWQSEFDIPEGIVDTVRLMNSAPFLLALSKIFGIKKIISDQYFTGGGLNITMPGGLLDVHVDGNYHDATGLNRRINAILYLNPSWQEGWGGEFGIYDNKGENCVKKIAPLYNRLVVFDTHDKSYHGLPDPLNFPEGDYRKSIILYYYTKAEREAENNIIEKPHSALWKKRNFLDKRGNKTRKYS
ncbi:MAG: 2OG-Fe(II) oxygenase [Rickettsiaceae bacterium]|nr:2OG-Fe(II) oxygenase [Rickettsiaceae bacterium]